MVDQPVFNLGEALERVDQDREIFEMMAELFMEHGPQDVAAVKAALTAGDATAVARCAHRLKGSVMQFCAPTVLALAKELETIGKTGDVSAAAPVFAELEAHVLRLVGALRQELEKGLAA